MLMFFIDIGYLLLGMDTGNLDTDMDKGMDMGKGKGRLVGCTQAVDYYNNCCHSTVYHLAIKGQK